ncbi:hypothetical protein VTK26DRAFT_2437 [Humicola hyalothermophila]
MGPGGAAESNANVKRRHPCLEKGDVFRTLGLPSDLIVGLDTIAMTTSKSLSGFRDIPPGAHLLWVQQPGGVSRCGYWFVTGRTGCVRAKQWDRYNEELGEVHKNHIEVFDLEAVYPSLQPYTLHQHKTQPTNPILAPTTALRPDWMRSPSLLWQTLTSAISTSFLAKITGRTTGVKEYFIDSADSGPGGTLSIADRAPASESGTGRTLTFLFTQDLRDLRLLDQHGPPESRAADTSPRILALLARDRAAGGGGTEQDVLAELQFALLTGANLGSPACIEHWWALVLRMVLRAHGRLPVSRPRLAADLLRTLHAQLFYVENYVGGPSSRSRQQDGQSGRGGGGGGTATDGSGGESVVFQFDPRNRTRLRLALAEYKRRLGEVLRQLGDKMTAEQRAVGRAFEELEDWLGECGWDLKGEEENAGGKQGDVGGDAGVGDSEDEDDPPMVVELDEEGREVGLVSFRD